MKTRTKILLSISGAGLVLATAGTHLWIKRFHHYTPIEVAQDIRAGIMSEHAPQPVERFLELRYGPMSDPANRRRAFLDFFNFGHIEGLQLLTSHMHGDEQRTNILGMAEWLARYRETMSAEEKQELGTYLNSDEGHKMMKQAAGQYLHQDVHYRANTSPVIAELMKTLAAVKQQP